MAHTALPLRPLDEDDATALAAHRLAELGAADRADRAADLASLADGNPLFIEQIVAALAETGEPEAALPTTVKGLIAARLDALPPAARAVLLDAAVAGRVFWRGALERMAPDREDLDDALAELRRRDLLRRETVSAFEGDHQYTFTHVLVRDVAYELLPRAKRQERHRATASFLEQMSGGIGEAGAAIARHLRDAGDHARAIDYFAAAAELAEHGWAKERAAALYREALQLAVDSAPERQAELRRRLAIAETARFHVFDARMLGRRGDER